MNTNKYKSWKISQNPINYNNSYKAEKISTSTSYIIIYKTNNSLI